MNCVKCGKEIPDGARCISSFTSLFRSSSSVEETQETKPATEAIQMPSKRL